MWKNLEPAGSYPSQTEDEETTRLKDGRKIKDIPVHTLSL